jgi:hypothetical protein
MSPRRTLHAVRVALDRRADKANGPQNPAQLDPPIKVKRAKMPTAGSDVDHASRHDPGPATTMPVPEAIANIIDGIGTIWDPPAKREVPRPEIDRKRLALEMQRSLEPPVAKPSKLSAKPFCMIHKL